MNAHSEALAPAPPTKPVRLPKLWPVAVRVGDVTVKIYRTPTTVRGKNVTTFTLSYYANGRRQRRQFVDYAKAKAEADRIAEQKAQGALGAAALSPSARLALQDALTLLAKVEGTGHANASRLVDVVRDYAGACAALPKGATLTEAARFFALRHPANAPRRTVAEVVAEFISDRESAGCSPVHLRGLRVCLQGRFAKAFALPINAVSAPLVQQWVSALQNQRTKKPARARTKENMLRMIASLFSFARRMKYVPADLALEIAEIPPPQKEPAPIGIYTAGEIAAVLGEAAPDIVPALAVAAFAGLRLAEVARLDYRDVRLDERTIVVQACNAKTAARRLVPISDNLAAWLAPHAKRFGPLNPCDEGPQTVGNALGDRFERAAARAKIPWKRNGLRHSYISYRVAVLKNVPEVALECGNSPAVIFSAYRALATEAEGRAWFNVMPPKPAENILPHLPQAENAPRV